MTDRLIPKNTKVQQEFINCIEDSEWEEVMNAIRKSDELLKATLNRDEDRVAEIIEDIMKKPKNINAELKQC